MSSVVLISPSRGRGVRYSPRGMSQDSNTTGIAPGAKYAVVVLTAMNLLNYMDRYVPSAVKELFKEELHFTDAETSYPLTAFVVVYMIASPIFGSLADKAPRKILIAIGVALWSAATAAASFATNFTTFLLARATVGIGEAAYATITPSIISDFYPPDRRNRILTIFYVAIPVGAAIGFTLGGVLGAHYGWRTAFLACGLPGIATAGLVLFMREPQRGRFDIGKPLTNVSWPVALADLSKRREFVIAVAGYTAVTFASGALADWFPAFLSRYRGFSVAEAGSLTGTTSALGGLVGTVLGGLLGDTLKGKTRQPYLALSAFSMAGAIVFASLALLAHGKVEIGACMLAAQVLLWCYNGPVNALIVNAVPSALRTRAVSVSIFSIHLFGDAASPSIVGFLADRTGSLHGSISIVPVAMAVGAGIWFYGWRSLPDKEAVA